MPFFQYKATNNDGIVVSGLVEASSENSAVDILREKNLSVLTMKERKLHNIEIEKYLVFLNRIKPKDIVIFSRQFSIMISANVVVIQALRIITEQTENIRLKSIISEIADEVDNGSRLSDALEKRPNVFSQFYVSVVRSGEASGKLDEVVSYLADEMEKDYDMLSKIKGAMMYPAFIVCGLGVVATLMMIFVIPQLTSVFSETGGELPMATKVLIAVSDFMRNSWYILLVGLGLLIFGFRYYIKQPLGRAQFDYVLLKLPIFGNLFQKIYLVRFTRSMNTLILGGVTMVDSLKVSAEIVDNDIYKKLIEETIKEVEEGNTISGVFVNNSFVPKMVSQMIGVGEKTGKIDIVLGRISDFYTREINNLIANLMSLLEPIIMVVIGVAVGGMVVAVIMPMYNLASSF